MAMTSLLFIAPADLGETVLATGALDYALQPESGVTIVCDPDAAELFRAVPGLAAIHAIGRGAGPAGWRRPLLALAGRRFDLVIDARNAVLGKLVRARQRVTPQVSSILRHQVEEWSDWMGAEQTLAPKLWLDDFARAAASEAAPGAEPLLILAPGGVAAAKRWPAERFAAIARRLFGGPLAGARVILLGAAERDGEVTRAIATSLDADGVPALNLGRMGLLAAAALLERATLCIGNDNALTHLAAAAGAPTLTLFGATDERVRAPYGKRTQTLRGQDYEVLMGLPALEGRSSLEDISVDAVEMAAQDLLRAGGL
jgi:lipopolysaccharide export system permease protein